jgi:hypothetical protein
MREKIIILFCLILQSFNTYASENHQDLGLSLESTQLYLNQIMTVENRYKKEYIKILNEFDRSISYNPESTKKDLEVILKKQKKVLEKRLKKAKGNIQDQTEAFVEFNRFLVVNIHRSEIKDILQSFKKSEAQEFELRKTSVESIKENPLSHLFNPQMSRSELSESFYYETKKLQKIIKKYQNLLSDQKRQKEITTGEYSGAWGKIRKVKDTYQKKGTFSKM